MPRAPKKCIYNKCTKASSFKGRCELHQLPREVWKKDTPDRSFLKTKEWLIQRRRVLYRDNTFNGGCQLKQVGCSLIATQVDHKIPVWYTGEERVNDEDLQGLCNSCHQKKSSFEGVQAKRIKKTRENNA